MTITQNDFRFFFFFFFVLSIYLYTYLRAERERNSKKQLLSKISKLNEKQSAVSDVRRSGFKIRGAKSVG